MRLPYTRILFQKSKCVAITAGDHICVFDSSSGRSISSTADRTDVKLGPIIAADICGEDGEYLVTAMEDKTLRVWRTKDLSVLHERIAVKKPTCLKVTKDASTILVSDKFGDVYNFSLNPPDATSAQGSSEAALKRTKTDSLESLGGKLLMGHVSLLTTFLLSPDEKFIVTADRDEHIRVSWYPESYVIESYCLGQKKFVSALHIPSWDSSRLFSGGGDPEIKQWNWMEGRLIAKYDVAASVLPFVKVVRRRTFVEDENGDEGDGGKQQTKAQKRKLRKKGKAKDDVVESIVQQEGAEPDEDAENAMDVDGSSTPARASSVVVGNEKEKEPILAISKIDSLETSSHKLCLFSGIGTTALFYFELPDSLETPNANIVIVKHHELGKPILDFYLIRESSEIWVLTDGECTEESFSSAEPTPMIRVLHLEGSDLKEGPESAAYPDLQKALNSSEILSSSNGTVDLYTLLASLPKNLDRDDEPNTNDTGGDSLEAQEISKKEQGRMKARRAREAVALKRASEGEVGNQTTEERDVKKSKGDPC